MAAGAIRPTGTRNACRLPPTLRVLRPPQAAPHLIRNLRALSAASNWRWAIGGTLRFDRPVHILGDLIVQSGTLDSSLAALQVQGAVKVSGGLLLTPRSIMHVTTMDIQAPGIVRMSTNGRLTLSGDGMPLTGNGLLDVTTNRPNSVQYIGHATSNLDTAGPATGLKIDPATVQRALKSPTAAGKTPLFSVAPISLTLNAGEDYPTASVVDTANGFAYFATTDSNTGISSIVKVDVATFTRVGAITLPAAEDYLYSAAIDIANGYAYFGSFTSPAYVVKIDIAPASFGRVGSLALTTLGEDNLTSAVIDPAQGFAYFGTSSGAPGVVIKINLNGAGVPTRNSAITLGTGEDYLGSGVIDTVNHIAYFGAGDITTYGGSGHIVKVALSPTFTRTAGLTLSGAGENFLTLFTSGAAIDRPNGYAYFGTSGDGLSIPPSIVKVQLAGSMTRVAALQPFGLSTLQVTTGLFDPIGGYAYFGGYDAPGVVAKTQLTPTFTTVQTLTLNVNEDYPQTGVIDPSRHVALFGLSTAPGSISRVLLSNAHADLTSSANPSVFGQTVTFTATINALPGTAGRPTGVVTFTVDGGSSVTRTLVAAGSVTSTATYTTSSLSAGTRTIGLAYGGDGTFTPDSTALIQLVNKADTSSSLASSNNPSVFGQSVTFTTIVTATSPGVGTPSGIVTFTFDGAANVTATLNASRVAMYVTSTLSVATHPVTVTYGGDSNFNGNSSSISQVVNKANTTAGVTTSATPTVFGQPITLTAIVTPTSPGAGTPTGTVTFTFDGSTNVVATLNASRVATYVTSTLSVATHPIVAVYGGDTSFNGSTSSTVNQVVNKAATTTSLASAPNPSVFGQGVIFTATVAVTAPGGGTPTGTVTFFDGVTNIGSGSVNASGLATAAISSLSVGPHATITAQYGGDANFNTSTSSAYSQTVNKASTTTIVTSSPNPSVFGQSVTFTATVLVVAPGTGTPSGTVAFFDGATNIGTGSVNVSGIATLVIAPLSVGAHSAITAQYGGDTNFNGSTSSAYLQTVNKADTTTGVSAVPNPSVFGQSVTLTAIVTATAPGAGTPTGTITFTFDGSINAVATLNGSRVATYVTTTLSVAAHPVTAAYGGDGNFNTSSASLPTQTVNKANTTTTVTSSPNASIFGQNVTFTATVVASAPGAGNPSGTVTFTIDAAPTNVTLVNGVATFSASSLSVGGHPVSVTYSGDNNFNTSSGTLPTQTVNKASTTTNVASSVNASIFGQSVTFTATVAVVSPGVGIPTGLVTFTIDGTPIAVASSGGVATYVTSTLVVGPHSVSATYGGDGSFNSSSGTLPTQTVNKTSTTTSLTSAPNAAVFGQSVTFTVTVGVVAPGTGNPSGSVTFFDGATNIGSGAVGAGGIATLTTSALAVGAHSNVTASYGGDADFNGSTSSAYLQTVNKASTAITITTSAPSPSVYLQSVTFTYTLSVNPPGAGTPTGVVTITDGTQNCVATLPATDCAITFNTVGAKSLTAMYSGDGSFTTATSAAFAHTVTARPPMANDDSYTIVENAVMNVAASGVLSNDVPLNGRPITSTLLTSPITGTLVFNTDGSFVFTPTQYFNGVVTYTYQANDAGLVSNAATVTITVLSVNQPPSFTPGSDISVFTSTQFISNSWATNISVGPANESAQTVAFTVTTNNPNLFQIPPAVSPTGTLSFKPAPFYAGTAIATVFAQDNGGTANGGVDTSPSITFTIVISSDPDVPTNLVPAAQTTYINQALVFSSGNGNAISVSDPDAALVGEVMSMTLSATSGTLHLGSLAGLIVTPTSGVGSVVSLSGLITPTNSALSGLTFTPTLNFVGLGGVVVETQDLGHFGEPASFVVASPIDINVIDTPIASVNAANSSPTALGSATFFTATQSGGTHVTYVWDFGDGITTTGQTASHSYGAIGNYTAIVTASNPTNHLSVTTPVTMVDAAITGVAASNNSPTVFGSSTQFTATQTGGTNVAYAWDFGDNTTGSGANPSHIYTAVGSYTAVVTGTNGVSAKSAITPVTINKATPLVTITGHAVDPSVVGESVTITFTVTPPGAGMPTDTVTVTDSTQTCSASVATGQCSIAFASPGVKSLTAQYSGDTNFNGATSGSVSQTVNKADTTTSITVVSPALFGQVWPITATVAPVAPGAGTPSGTITVTDGAVSCVITLPGTSCNLTFNVLGGHTITATYSGNANFNGSNATTPLTVIDVSITGLSASNSSPTRLDDTTFFTASQTSGTNIVYAWNFGDGSAIGSGVNVTHTYALSGTYTAIVTATNSVSSQFATTAVMVTNQRPIAVASNAAFSLNSTATLDGSHSNDPDNHYPLTYFWAQTGGGAVSFAPNVSVTTFTAPSSPTILTFTLTVTDAHGLASLPKTVSITIADIAITGLAASNDSPTEIGVQTTFTATVLTGSSVNYTWNFGDNTTGSGANPNHIYGVLGNYTALVTATNSQGTFTTTTPITIVKATPMVLITSHTPSPSVVGESVTIGWSVTPSGLGTPTGTVTVTASGQSCSANVAIGSCSIAFTSSGLKSLSAQYNGDTNFNAATSASVNHTVDPANTTTSVASSANPSVFGQSVTFTATVAASAPGAGTPTGTVAFTIDGMPVGTATLSGGVASYVTSTLSVMTHPMDATYNGDANFNGSSSGTLNQVVNAANTSTSVASSANPSVFGQSVTFTATVTASAPGAGTPSGVVTFTIDGAPTVVALSGGLATLTTSSLTVGLHSVLAAYSGDGNFNTSSGSLPTQTVNKANSTTAVASSPNPSVISQTVTFTATVTANAPGAGDPSGVVTFTIDASNVATATLSGGVATYSTSGLAVGSHPVSVAYSGDGSFNASTGGLTQVVNKPPSATSVTSAPNPSMFGQSVTFTATVVPVSGGPTPTGLVTFTIDGSTAGSASLSGGVASISSAALAVGAHPVVVTYGGDGNFNSSASSTYTQTVTKAGTATSVTSAPNPSVFGQSVTLTATVTASAPGAGHPSGTVTFFDGATNLGTGAVNGSGIATLATSSLAVGAHPTITGQYGGDASFNGSTSSAHAHTVEKANSTTNVSAAPNPSVFGQSVTFTATVAASVPGAPGAGSPSGTVTFMIDGAPAGGAITLSGGVATYATSTLAVGSHNVSATYSGDGNFNGSAASSINQAVNKANTTTTVVSSLNPAPVTKLITFTATIAAVAPGAGTPTGVVTFTIDGVTVGTPMLSGGVAIYSTSALPVGPHTVSATYGGDGSFNLSTGLLTPNQVVSQYHIFLPIMRR